MYMQVPAPQWIQASPRGPVFVQPAGAAAFANQINPLEATQGLSGGRCWSGMAGLSGFVRLYGDMNFESIYTKFANESQDAYLARAKRQFQQEYGPVVPEPDEPELHAYSRVKWEADKAKRTQQEHIEKYNTQKWYRDEVQKAHLARMASDPEYAAWVEAMAISTGESTDSPAIIAQTFAVDPAFVLNQQFTSTAPNKFVINAEAMRAKRIADGSRMGDQHLAALPPDNTNKNLFVAGVAVVGLGAIWWMTRPKKAKE
jgi:hypothetical protein